MAIPIINDWKKYFSNPHEGLGSSYERVVINDLLLRIVSQHGIRNVLESPSFGFTGLSGINLVELAQNGVAVTLEDHDRERLALIQALWDRLQLPLQCAYNVDYKYLNYPQTAFDMSFSFSALWFVSGLPAYLRELCRVTAKLIFISVPNTHGFGYKMQARDYSPDRYPELRITHIDPRSIRYIMHRQNWELMESGLFDCPPWPDIGMTKEDFLHLPKKLPSQNTISERKVVTILDYYLGKDPGFPERMRRFGIVERMAPRIFKRYWAHHYYMVFRKRM